MNHKRESRPCRPNLGVAVALGLMACLAAAGAIRKQAFEQYEMERDVAAFDAAMAEDDGTRVTLEQMRDEIVDDE